MQSGRGEVASRKMKKEGRKKQTPNRTARSGASARQSEIPLAAGRGEKGKIEDRHGQIDSYHPLSKTNAGTQQKSTGRKAVATTRGERERHHKRGKGRGTS